MSPQKPDAITRTVQKTELWMSHIARNLHTEDERVAYHALRSVLHALRDRLSVEDAAALGAQLPMLLRGLYYEGWHPHGKPLRVRDAEEFMEVVADEIARHAEHHLDPKRAIASVFAELEAQIDSGEIEKIRRVLPPSVRALFD